MRRLAEVCVRRRRAVVLAWLVLLVVCTLAGRSAGSAYTNSLALPGAGSTQATELLQSVAPAVSGDIEQVVMESTAGAVSAPAVRPGSRRCWAGWRGCRT